MSESYRNSMHVNWILRIEYTELVILIIVTDETVFLMC